MHGKAISGITRTFLTITNHKKLQIFDAILDFFQHVIKKGYIAIDFYDGSIMYDFEEEKTYLCDIDFFKKQPYVNNMGRMWGSSRFMSPEEFQFGSVIDEITNVFLAGAIAFALFGGETNHSIEKWMIPTNYYSVALKAVNPNREDRYSSIHDFIQAWKGAGKKEDK